MSELCFHHFVHFDCFLIYIFSFHHKQCASDQKDFIFVKLFSSADESLKYETHLVSAAALRYFASDTAHIVFIPIYVYRVQSCQLTNSLYIKKGSQQILKLYFYLFIGNLNFKREKSKLHFYIHFFSFLNYFVKLCYFYFMYGYVFIYLYIMCPSA